MMKPLIVITGPTATGKTRRAVQVAGALGGEIISADSRQVYSGMDLGTGKDLEEYGNIPYHLIDILPAGEKYNLHRFLADYRHAIEAIDGRGAQPILCGGTGMYVEAAVNGVQMPEVPENTALRAELSGKSLDELTAILSTMKSLHNTTDVDTTKRAIRAIEIQKYYQDHPAEALLTVPGRHSERPTLIIAIDIPREERRRRITSRLERRLDEGMVDEVRALLHSGVNADDLIYYGLEYKFLTLYVLGRITYDEMRSGLEIAIHQFAKRQMTWFRGMERRGLTLHWLPYDMDDEEFVARVKSLLSELAHAT